MPVAWPTTVDGSDWKHPKKKKQNMTMYINLSNIWSINTQSRNPEVLTKKLQMFSSTGSTQTSDLILWTTAYPQGLGRGNLIDDVRLVTSLESNDCVRLNSFLTQRPRSELAFDGKWNPGYLIVCFSMLTCWYIMIYLYIYNTSIYI